MQLSKSAGLIGLLGSLGYWLWRYIAPQHSTMILANKVVVITGASSGIGRALALEFAQQGARVVLAARRIEKLEGVRRELEPYAEEVLIVPTDLRQEADLQHLIDLTLKTFGRIDILVNNAGVTYNGDLESQNPAHIREMVLVDLYAPMRLTQLALPEMRRQEQGAIINIGSVSSRTAAPLFSTYTAAKYGIAGFTTSLRRELAGSRISVLLALPGWTQTEMIHGNLHEGVYRSLPIDTPESVARSIVEALVRGDREVIFGGSSVRWVVFLEQHFPRLAGLGWRLAMQQNWQTIAQRISSDDTREVI